MATNAAVPGIGTLLAGRTIVGVIQTIMGLAGFGLSLVYGTRMLNWTVANWSRVYDPYGDPAEMLPEIWSVIFWPLIGLLLFGVAWVWSVLSTWYLVKKAGAREPPPVGGSSV